MYTATPSSRLDIEQAEAQIAWVTQARCREVDPTTNFLFVAPRSARRRHHLPSLPGPHAVRSRCSSTIASSSVCGAE